MIRTYKRRALGTLLFSVSRSDPASTDGKLLCGCGETRRLHSRVVVVVVQRIDRCSYICVNLVLLLYEYQELLSYYLVKDRCHFSI